MASRLRELPELTSFRRTSNRHRSLRPASQFTNHKVDSIIHPFAQQPTHPCPHFEIRPIMSFPSTTLANQFYVTRALDIIKMKAFLPCEIDDPGNNYQATITEIVLDPLRIPEVNAHYRAAGYCVPDDSQVFAVTADGSILVWGGLNSVIHLQKGDSLKSFYEGKHLAFNDIRDLTARFKTKNKRVEIDEMIAQLEATYGSE
jgi:hypothetical protein